MKDYLKKNGKKRVFILLFMYFIMESMLTGWLYLNEHPVNGILGSIFITTGLFGIITFYIVSSNPLWDKLYKTGIAYCFLLLLIMISFFLPDLSKPIWVVSVIFTSLIGPLGGICFNILFLFISAFLFQFSMDIIIIHLITGIAAALLTPYMKTKKLTGMCIIIIAGVHISVLSGLILLYEKEFLVSDIKEILIGIIIGIFLMILFFIKVRNPVLSDKRLEEKLILITDKDYVLMKIMKEKSIRIYEHGLKVGELSKTMAEIIGADPLLSMAGGYYYKAGKILGKDYYLYGAEIGKEYSLPIEVVAIISEHPGKADPPSTIESGIVMLADTVVSGFEYLHSKNLNIEFDRKKAVEQMLWSRVEKGFLDNAKISIRMYETLKAYLIQEGSKL